MEDQTKIIACFVIIGSGIIAALNGWGYYPILGYNFILLLGLFELFRATKKLERLRKETLELMPNKFRYSSIGENFAGENTAYSVVEECRKIVYNARSKESILHAYGVTTTIQNYYDDLEEKGLFKYRSEEEWKLTDTYR